MGGKIIVTHNNPDLDAVTSIWLIVRWLPGWEGASFKFVPAGKTYRGEKADSKPNVLHVDTGLGKLDHHQTDEYICAAKLTLEYIKRARTTGDQEPAPRSIFFGAELVPPRQARGMPADSGNMKTISKNKPSSNIKSSRSGLTQTSVASKNVPTAGSRHTPSNRAGDDSSRRELKWNAEALDRLVEVVNGVDHFQEVYYAEPEADYLLLGAEHIFDGWKLLYREEDGLVVEKGLEVLDGIYISFISKIEAEKILEEKGEEFKTKWGKGIAAETKNDMFDDIAQKKGYKITVRKHPELGHIRIKAMPENKLKAKSAKLEAIYKIDLSPVYNRLMEIEKERRGDWFLHSSKTMLLNGSAKNPKMRPTKLNIGEVIKIIKAIK